MPCIVTINVGLRTVSRGDMGVAIYGNYGGLSSPSRPAAGTNGEEGQSMIRTLSPYIEQGRIRIFCINSVNSDSFQTRSASLPSELDAGAVRRLCR